MTCRPYFSAGTIFWPSVDELRLHPEHDRHVRPVDVGVDDADLAAALREREREVHGDRRLADAALARADGDDVLHAGQRCRVPSEPTASRTRALIVTSTRRDAGHLHHRRARLIAHLILDRTRRRRQLDRERDAAAVDLQILDEPEADDVAVEIGIPDDLQRVEHAASVRLAYPQEYRTLHAPCRIASPNRGVMIVLAYLWLLALIPLLLEKQDAEVQWHAKHGLVLMARGARS